MRVEMRREGGAESGTDVPVPQLPHRLVLKLQFAAIHMGANFAASLQVL